MTKIIIVEDDPMISEIYQKKFKEAGFDVSAATSGEQVLIMAKNDTPEVILLDLIMPKLSGFEVIEKIRTEGYDHNIKIIVSSNLSQKEDRDKAIKLGANGFVVKSDFTPTGLVEEVKRLLNQMKEEKINEKRFELAKQNGSQEVGKKGKKILMVEDEEIFLEMFGEKLKQNGYEFDSANNGVIGLKKAFQENYDLFIIDMIMPAMGGEEIIEKLKAEDKTKDTPIVVLSASVDQEAQRRVEEMGITSFFIKTQLTPSELANKIDEILLS